MRIKLQGRAEDNLADGYRFYERQRHGAGAYFLECLYADIASLERNAGIHAMQFGYYRLISQRFPHAIYYKIEGHVVHVHAVLDSRRDPAWIERRLK